MESVLGKEMKDNYSHSYMGQKRFLCMCDGQRPNRHLAT